MEKITLCEVIKWTDGTCFNKKDIIVKSITTDSRNISDGALFIALKGKNFDGHDFAGDAIKSGAKAVVVEKQLPFDIPQIVVSDTLIALGNIAKNYRRKFYCPIIGITGSDGKTTTKEMCAHLLSAKFCVCKNHGNFNNQIGLPLSIMNLDKTTEIGIFELGMNNYGELRYLGGILQPDIVIITSIGYAHLGFFKNRRDLAMTKAEILESVRSDGLIVINRDTNFLDVLKGNTIYPPVTIGMHPSSDFRAIVTDYTGNEITLKIEKWKHLLFKIKSWNGSMIYPSLFSIFIADYFGVPRSTIAKYLYDFNLINGRGQIKECGNVKIFDESYNANPASMSMALQYFARQKARRKIAVIGQMAELGRWSKFYHRKIANLVEKLKFDAVFTVGSDAKIISESFSKTAKHFDNVGDMIEYMQNFITSGDAVFVKGSRINNLEILVQSLIEKLER